MKQPTYSMARRLLSELKATWSKLQAAEAALAGLREDGEAYEPIASILEREAQQPTPSPLIADYHAAEVLYTETLDAARKALEAPYLTHAQTEKALSQALGRRLRRIHTGSTPPHRMPAVRHGTYIRKNV
jgi:hypothetical protein